MAQIRAFTSTWVNDNGQIADLITIHFREYAEINGVLPFDAVLSSYYSETNPAGVPTYPFLFVLADGDGVDALEGLDGVDMLPAINYQTPMDELSQQQVTSITVAFAIAGIPPSVMVNASVYGDCIAGAVRFIDPNFNGFGEWYEITRSADWG